MTEYTRRVIIVITAEDQSEANAASDQLDTGGAGERTFTVPLNPTGDPADPPTHYWCSTVATEAQYRQILGMKAGLFPEALVVEWDTDAEPNKPDEVLKSLGLRRSEAVPRG